MPGERIYFEEAASTSVATYTLLRFFKRFFIPYKKTILVTIMLALSAIGADLLMPQLIRVAIDRHITVAARKISLRNSAVQSPGIMDWKNRMVAGADETSYFILPGLLSSITEEDIQQASDMGILLPDKYYFTTLTPKKMAVLKNHAVLFTRTDHYLFIKQGDLACLSVAERTLLRSDDIRGIWKITAYFICILLGFFVLTFAQIYLVEFTSQKIMHDLRMEIFTHLQSRSLAFFTENPVGRLVTRATNDVQNLHEMFNALFANIMKDIFMILGIMAVLFYINWKLSLVCFSVLPLLVCCTLFFSVKSRKAFREVRIKIAAINAKIQENISGIGVVKAFCRERLNEAGFQKLNQENYAANMRQTLIFSVFNPIVDITRISAIALIIWYGGGQALRNAVSLGTVVVFLYYMRMFFRPIQDLAEKYNIIQSAFASLERIYLLFQDKNRIHNPSEPENPATMAGYIEFKNVSFSYNPDEPVLENISFSVRQGETVAIVGPTGAGKSTIINLLERFYDVQEGSILIDGRDIREMDTSCFRKHIGLVLQDVFLFAGTVRSNISLDSTGFSDADLDSALAIANADKLVTKLPHGLDEDVKEGGKTLSSGERQLLSFARAIVTDPAILILDEATSNIDPVTEGLIQEALDKLMRNRTSLIIAHRLSTIKKADRILVLHKGRVYEEGTHDELMQKQGLYYRLSQLQYMN